MRRGGGGDIFKLQRFKKLLRHHYYLLSDGNLGWIYDYSYYTEERYQRTEGGVANLNTRCVRFLQF